MDTTWLEEREIFWTEHLTGDSGLPLLGLAPLLVDEESKIIEKCHQWMYSPGARWSSLFDRFPATMGVWFACAAGSAYSEGTFWANFEREVGMEGVLATPQNRKRLLDLLDGVAIRLGLQRAPLSCGTFSLVSGFLFHAGFPNCHSRHFAQAIRSVQRDGELPDPDDPEAGQELCELVGWRLRSLQIPTLRRALKGPAGPLVCRAALQVLFEGDFSALNPRIAIELEEAFKDAPPVRNSPSLKAPYLRLSDDYSSLELVCPIQDASLLIPGSLKWLIDGVPNFCPLKHEFVCPVTIGASKIKVEMQGLASYQKYVREYDLPCNDPRGLWIFDEGTRKLRRVQETGAGTATIPAGRFSILHSQDGTWPSREFEFSVSGSHSVVSMVELHPGQSLDYLRHEATPFCLRAADSASLWLTSGAFTTNDGERVLYGDAEIAVWCPSDQDPRLANWIVRIRDDENGIVIEKPISAEDWQEEDGQMVSKLQLSSSDWGGTPGLHEVVFSLIRGKRTLANKRSLYWMGLTEFDADPIAFVCNSLPSNLIKGETVGFGKPISGRIAAVSTNDPFRVIAFKLGIRSLKLRWRQSGVFLQTVDRCAGATATITSHPLESGFTAAIESNRWLRIWTDQSRSLLMVNGEDLHLDFAGDRADISLADLGTRFPTGGSLILKRGDQETYVARFSSPLTPKCVARLKDEEARGHRFSLREPIRSARVVCQELSSLDSYESEAVSLENVGSEQVLQMPGFPPIQLVYRRMRINTDWYHDIASALAAAIDHDDHPIEKTDEWHLFTGVPLAGWPPGVWVIMTEARQSEYGAFESLAFGKGKLAPILVVSPPGDEAVHSLLGLIVKAWVASNQVPRERLDVSGYESVFDEIPPFLRRLSSIFPHGFASGIDNDFDWIQLLEQAVASAVGKELREGNSSHVSILLDMADDVSGIRRLLRSPEVFAVSSVYYHHLSEEEPLLASLRIMNWLSGFDWLLEVVMSEDNLLSPDFFCKFGNIMALSANPDSEFCDFDSSGYWKQLTSAIEDPSFDSHLRKEVLGPGHWYWACSTFLKRYKSRNPKLDWGIAMGCIANCGINLRIWMRERCTIFRSIVSNSSGSMAPILTDESVFTPLIPEFCSTWALVSRLAAHKQFSMTEALETLRKNASKDQILLLLQILLESCPEMFGFFLIFWETQIKTFLNHE